MGKLVNSPWPDTQYRLCQRGRVSNKSPGLQTGTRHGARDPEEKLMFRAAEEYVYCHVPVGWGLQQTTRAPGSDKTRGQGSFGPFTCGLNLTPTWEPHTCGVSIRLHRI